MTWLTVHQLERAHPNRCLESGTVCPECVTELERPILPCSSYGLLQNRLDLPVGNLSLTVSLRMIGSGYLVGYPMTTQEIVELAVDEVLASIADHGSWHSKAREDDVGEQSPHGT